MHSRRTLLLVVASVALPVLVAAPEGPSRYIAVKRATVRADPSHNGRVIGGFVEGTKVFVLKEQDDWLQVVDSQRRGGWVNQSALSEKPVAMRAGDKAVETGATGEEAALATKGFDEKIEGEFKKKNPNLDYKLLDWVEKEMAVSPDTQAAFLIEGQVKPVAGGAK